MSDIRISDEARQLHADALLWDMTVPWIDWGGDRTLKPLALERLAAAKYDVAALTVASDEEDIATTTRLIARERAFIRDNQDRYTLIETAGDILRAKSEGKLALCFQFQGSNPIGRDIAMIEVYYKLGVRLMLMAYNQKNAVGDGCHERTDSGLSRFGIEVVQEMNRVGMLVDVTHTGYRTSMDVFNVAEGPVIFSHSNPKALYDHPRNIQDDQILACARTGGVIGINGVGIFIGDNDASTDQLMKQIDYLCEKAGPQHVGIGLDWVYDQESLLKLAKAAASRYPSEGGYDLDVDFAAPEQLLPLTQAMLDRNYSPDDIRNILGANWLRVAGQVWKA